MKKDISLLGEHEEIAYVLVVTTAGELRKVPLSKLADMLDDVRPADPADWWKNNPQG